MGIREIIAQKKLEKSSEVMLPLMMEEVYKRIKSLTDAKFHDYEAELKQKATSIAGDLMIMCEKMAQNMRQNEQLAIQQVESAAISANLDLTTHVTAIREETKVRVDKLSNELIAQINVIASNIEKMRGPQGEPGKKGDKGDNGSPDTAEQVVAKVNKAKGVKMSSIDGLEDELKKAKKGGGGKSGGGMGNVYHETKAISSGTTSITTTYPVAANGRACWLFYQGQFLVYGTHYTVSGNVFTLTFDKIDSTYLDLTYIRG